LTNKRKDPNYEQITGLVPKEISRRFKQLLAVEGLKISDGVTEAIKFYLKEHEPKLSAALNPLPETIAELVQQNFYQLLTDGKITTDKLKAIASGSKPNASDLSKIAHTLDIPEEQLVAMRDQDFPTQKRKQP
jgi:hypothetical protein